MATAEKILLGLGVFTVGTTPIGLTRGGGVFTVEREYREMPADGDRGPVKGRIVIDTERAKMVVNGLDLFNATDMKKYYPGLSVTPDVVELPTKQTTTSTLVIDAGDYNDVKWVGKTKDGKNYTIIVKDAINLDNLEFKLEDKNEVVATLGFVGTYTEDQRDTPTWSAEQVV